MNKVNKSDCEEIQKSLYMHIKSTQEETVNFSQNLNIRTINETISFCKNIVNIINEFFKTNQNKIKDLSEDQELSIFTYENKQFIDKEDILDFLSKDLLNLLYQEATTSEKVNKFEKSNIKENLEIIFEEYMNIDVYTIPYLKPHLKANNTKKLTEKIDYQEDFDKNVKSKYVKKLF